MRSEVSTLYGEPDVICLGDYNAEGHEPSLSGFVPMRRLTNWRIINPSKVSFFTNQWYNFIQEYV